MTSATVPAGWGGVVTSISVALTNVVDEAPRLANSTVAPETKFVPVIATVVPPVDSPESIERLVIVGPAVEPVVNVKLPGRVALDPSGFFTVTPTTPAEWAGVTA